MTRTRQPRDDVGASHGVYSFSSDQRNNKPAKRHFEDCHALSSSSNLADKYLLKCAMSKSMASGGEHGCKAGHD